MLSAQGVVVLAQAVCMMRVLAKTWSVMWV
jgi:hypothetical protein